MEHYDPKNTTVTINGVKMGDDILLFLLQKNQGSHDDYENKSIGIFDSLSKCFEAISSMEGIPVNDIKIDSRSPTKVYNHGDWVFTDCMFKDEIYRDNRAYYNIDLFNMNRFK